MKNILLGVSLVMLLAVLGGRALAVDIVVKKDTRCAVCGMFVAKYPNWVTRATLSDGQTEYFDGVKDMMAYFFAPQKYGAKAGVTVSELTVNDYYTLSPVNAKQAFFVMGGDVPGPMGPDLVPFASKAAAESFSHDHHGHKVLAFSELTAELIEKIRSGSKMMMN